MIFKSLLSLANRKGTSHALRKSGLQLKKHLTIEFSEKQGAFLFDGQTGKSWTLNPRGSMILRGLLNGDAAQTIVETLRGRFQVSATRAYADVTDFRSTLVDKGHLANHE